MSLELCKHPHGAKGGGPVLPEGADVSSTAEHLRTEFGNPCRCFPGEPKVHRCEKAGTIQEIAGGSMRPKVGGRRGTGSETTGKTSFKGERARTSSQTQQ